MEATLKLNLGHILPQEDLRELLGLCTEQNKPLEVVLFEAAKEKAARLRKQKSAKSKPLSGH